MAPIAPTQAPDPPQNQGRLYEIIFDTNNINFDNYINSLISLFVLSTLEGWPNYLFLLIDGGE